MVNGIAIDHETAAKYILDDRAADEVTNAPLDENNRGILKKINRDRRCADFVKLLEAEVNTLIEQAASVRPWGTVDKTKLPASAFLWVEDPKKKTTWHLPYREGSGGIDPDTGMYRRAGPVNINALRAIAGAIAGARTGKPMTLPAAVRSKINRLFKQYKLGRFREQSMDKPTGRELIEESATEYFEGVEIDAESNVIKNVAILRPTSRNCTFKQGKGRSYSQKARESTARLISGAKAFVDHPTKTELKERGGIRSVRDMLGFYEGGHVDKEGVVRADLHYLENHKPWFEPMVKQMGDKVGKSIHAYGSTYLDQDTKLENVEDIVMLTSADLVTSPGSTHNLFESQAQEDALLDEQESSDEEIAVTIEELTLRDLEEGNPSLILKIKEQFEGEQNHQGEVASLKEQVTTLTTERDEVKTKLDEYEVAEKLREKEELILNLVNESKLPKEAVTKVFLESLRAAENEEKIKGLIEDRKKLIGTSQRTGVTGMGDEADLSEATPNDSKADEKKVAEAAGIVLEEAK